MRVLGVDLAAEPTRTYACALEARQGTLQAQLFARCDDDRLRELARDRDKVAIDAPFGWPREFVLALEAHRRQEAWPAPDDEAPEVFRAALSFRATDRVVMQTRRPLSVSTDKLGVTAMRCAHLLHRWAADGEQVDRTGGRRFVEVYPAGALARWGLPAGGYKGRDRAPLAALVAHLRAALPQLELTEEHADLCARFDDAFDALVAALVARAALLGLADGPHADTRELAAEEGWIHLPVRGSLPLLARERDALRSRPTRALADRLRETGLTVDARGYVGSFDDAVLHELGAEVRDAVRRDLEGKGGSELLPRGDAPAKFLAAHSSAALAANVFGPWLTGSRPLYLGGRVFLGEAHLEVELPTGLRGTPPTLDLLVEGERVLAVESKCTEPFATHEAHFAASYRVTVEELAGRGWREEFERLCGDPLRYRYLDAAQLVKHHLGLRRRFGNRPVTLAYLYWEPANAADVAECVVHRAEVAEFAGRVAGGSVEFVPLAYPDLWAAWQERGGLREHVGALRRRYVVPV